jgi:DNA-binding transcriptional LysR family regulator
MNFKSKFTYTKSNHLDWDKLKVFYALAHAGTLEKTHEIIGMAISSISNHIRELEKDVGAILINRNKGAQGAILTEAGQTFFRATTDIYKRLEESFGEIEERENISGTIKVATTKAFGMYWLFPKLIKFKNIHPEIIFDVSLVDLFQNLVSFDADLYFAPKLGEQSSLIHEYLCRFEYYAYASKDYLEHHGIPKTTDDLDKHKIISWKQHTFWPQLNWLLTVGIQKGIEREPDLIVNDTNLLLAAVEKGLGIGLFSQYVESYSDNIIRVLENYDIGGVDFYMISNPASEKLKKIDLLTQYLKNNIL